MPAKIPQYIDGAKPLFIANSPDGFETVIRFDKEITIEYISICQYDSGEGFYLFGCDKEFNTHTDFYYDDLQEALEDAKRLYQTDKIVWTKVIEQ